MFIVFEITKHGSYGELAVNFSRIFEKVKFAKHKDVTRFF